MNRSHPLEEFHPVVRRWFERTYGSPSPPQQLGWPSISSGTNTLILAPTGSGKTLAAFLWAINHLVEQHLREDLPAGVRILYISPLKALNNDIERNLVDPLKGIRDEAAVEGHRVPVIRTAVRTGDTPQSRRTAMIKHPPDILITTPESLYLLLTSRDARKMLRTVQYVIVDEIHSICGNKRGVHLSLSLERLQRLADQEFVRIGLSATQRPLDTIAAFLGGQDLRGRSMTPRRVAIVDAGQRKAMDLAVASPVPDFSMLPAEGAWPLILARVLEEIWTHRTTLVFVNNRRLAERLAARLNELIAEEETGKEGSSFNLYAVPRPTDWSAGPTKGKAGRTDADVPRLIQAYHGSMSRQSREQMEEDLKRGALRALVATSSLELGIDIGSIDLVLQIQSPKGIARGLQRVGRSGHLISATSKGRILPTHREDLVESAVVARAMLNHEVELTSIPRDCLDVLAQQITAMVSVEEWELDALFDLVRQSYCYHDLSRKLFTSVVMMLAGRYTDEAFRELRARVSWDKVNNILRALPGTRQLAVTGGGTIADRGAYGVYLEDEKTKVGEVDEEFVYESRVGDTFLLGTNVWRMATIDANRVTVTPAPGEPARMPFWRGEGIGRSYELGAMIGRFRREFDEHDTGGDSLAWLQREYPVDQNASWNIQEYLRRQKDATGMIPNDRVLLVEGFRDEIGDPRLVVHSPFGRRVNGLLGMYVVRQLKDRTGVEPQMLYNDDGILLRTSDAAALPMDLLDGLTARGAIDVVLDELFASPVFGGQFRQNASRALLLPKLSPSRRTPLWLQRLRAGDLLQIARKFEDFPIVIETVRELLNDVLDFEHFKEIVSGIEQQTIRVASVQTESPSPFAAGLLLNFIAVYMYEWDEPRGEAATGARTVNRELLGDVVDLQTVPSMLRPEAMDLVERQLQHLTERGKVRSPEELMELLLRLGDLTDEEIGERCSTDATAMLDVLQRDNRAASVELAGGRHWIAGEERELYATLPSMPALRTIIRRYLEHHGPVAAGPLARRYGIDPDRVREVLGELSSDPSVVRGSFHAEAIAKGVPEWCFRPNLERMYRQTVSLRRKEITPCSIEECAAFLLRWQHCHPATRVSGMEGLLDILPQLHALSLPAEIWEREIFMRRVVQYDSSMMPAAAHGIAWQGADGGRTRMLFRGEGQAFSQHAMPPPERQWGEPARRILNHLERHGASFFNDLRSATRLSLDAMNAGLAELVWGGLVTNDLFSELAKVRRSTRLGEGATIERVEVVAPRFNPARGRILHSARKALRQVPGWSGRWSIVATDDILGPRIPLEEAAARQAAQLLERYGVLAREFHRREDMLPWPLIAAELQRLELRGEIRRGYFVEGLSGMQYALPSAVEELQRMRSGAGSHEPIVLLNACDPANPFGPGVPLPGGTEEPQVRLMRVPGTYLAFRGGTPILLLENYGSRIWELAGADPVSVASALREVCRMLRLPETVRPFREITIERINGGKPGQSRLAETLRALGFERGKNQTMRVDTYSLRER